MNDPQNTGLTFTKIRFSRGLRRRRILDDFTFRFDHYPIAVLGPNGAGKSTLLGIGAGILSPNKGSVSINGKTAGGVRGRNILRRRVGLVPQDGKGFSGLSVREVVAYSGWLKGLARRTAWDQSLRCLDRVNMTHLADNSSTRVSGGEARRMSIAQALVSNPGVLLLDEATTGLDPAERQNLISLIGEISEATPVIAATHEVDDLEEVFGYVCVLTAGQIAFTGTTTEFLSRATSGERERARAESAYAALLGAQRSGSH